MSDVPVNNAGDGAKVGLDVPIIIKKKLRQVVRRNKKWKQENTKT